MLLAVSKRFYLTLSSHRRAVTAELLYVDNPLRSMHSGIPCSVSSLVLRKPRDQIARVSSVVASIVTEKQIDIV